MGEGLATVEEKAKALNDFFQSQVVFLLRQMQETTTTNEMQAGLYQSQANEYLNRHGRAEHIKARYAIITSEYGD